MISVTWNYEYSRTSYDGQSSWQTKVSVLERFPSHRVFEDIEIWLKDLNAQAIKVWGALENIKIIFLKQNNDQTSSWILRNNHSLSLNMEKHVDRRKFDQLNQKPCLILDLPVLRGNLQWKLLLGTVEKVCFIEVFVLQVTIL